MRKLVESTFITLDGSIGNPQDWGPSYWDDEHSAYAARLLEPAEALLLGRATYDGFAASWPQRSGDPYTDKMNAMPKYVASTTLARHHVERHRAVGRHGRGGRRAQGRGRR